MRRIAIVHHPRSFFPLDLRAAIGEDLEPVWVLAGGSAQGGLARLLARTGPVVDAGLDAAEIAERLRAHRPEGIITFVDDTIRLTARLAAALELPYHSESVAATVVDKRLQRRAFAAAGVPGPRFWDVPEGAGELTLAQLAHEVSYPSVFKPAESSGSRGMRELTRPADLICAARDGGPAIVEEYLRDAAHRDPRFASYLSVESLVSAGTISHVAVCGRFELAYPFRETGNVIPAALPDGAAQELTELAGEAVRALGITTGVTHTEIKLTDAGPRVIEINARLGGRPPFVLRSVSDVNLFRTACELALGERIVMPLAALRAVGFWWMAQPPLEARAVGAVSGLEPIGRTPGVDNVSLDRRPGDTVDWREGTGGQVLTVRGRVPDHDALARLIASIDETLEIDYVTGAPASIATSAV